MVFPGEWWEFRAGTTGTFRCQIPPSVRARWTSQGFTTRIATGPITVQSSAHPSFLVVPRAAVRPAVWACRDDFSRFGPRNRLNHQGRPCHLKGVARVGANVVFGYTWCFPARLATRIYAAAFLFAQTGRQTGAFHERRNPSRLPCRKGALRLRQHV